MRVLAISSARAAARTRRADAPRAGRGRRVRELALDGRPARHQPRRIGAASTGVIDAMVRSPSGARCSQRYRWLDRYLAGEAFEAFARRRRRASAPSCGSSARETSDGDVARRRGTVPAVRPRRSGAVRRRRRDQRAGASQPRGAEPSRPKWRSLALVGVGIVLNLAAGRERGVRHRVGGAVLVRRASVRRAPPRARCRVRRRGVGRRVLLFARLLQLRCRQACSRAGSDVPPDGVRLHALQRRLRQRAHAPEPAVGAARGDARHRRRRASRASVRRSPSPSCSR